MSKAVEFQVAREKLILYRRVKNLSLSGMGEVMKVGSGNIALWESGKRNMSGPARRLIELLIENDKRDERDRILTGVRKRRLPDL